MNREIKVNIAAIVPLGIVIYLMIVATMPWGWLALLYFAYDWEISWTTRW